jgi:transposase-like protein
MKTTKLEILLNMHARAAGHTTATLHVAQQSGGVLIVSTLNHARELHRQHHQTIKANQLIPLCDLEEARLAGIHAPILVDHHALWLMLAEVRDAARDAVSAAQHSEILARAKNVPLKHENAILGSALLKIAGCGMRHLKKGQRLTKADRLRNRIFRIAIKALEQVPH